MSRCRTLSVSAVVALNQVNSQPPQRVNADAIAAIAQGQVQHSKQAAVAPSMVVAPVAEQEKAKRGLDRSPGRSKSRSNSSEHERKKMKRRKRSRSRSRSKSKEKRHKSSHSVRKESKHKGSTDRHRGDSRKKEHKDKHRRKEGKSKK